MIKYNFSKSEKKWQKYWSAKKIYKTEDKSKKKKFYILDMFPYPSGSGLHVGHVEGYTASDIVSRYKRMSGFNVLHPMGWDAFGLPAENYAIKNKIHPKVATDKNIKTYKKQLEMIGFDYDWSREINTTDENYYKWTQWMFLQMFKKGLAYESHEPIIWCPSCKTGLAQEDLEGDRCERCKSPVERKRMRQWVLRITDYAERLLNDLDGLDWHEKIKAIQRNWIGRSEGAEIVFQIPDSKFQIQVFTTRPDTLFGVTYLVLAPEHEMIQNVESRIQNLEEIKKYIGQSSRKTDLDRQENKEKTGVQLKGVMAVNPANGKEVPIWISDYVLAHYGTGAVMAVPAHDQRDFDFAKKFNLPVTCVIELSLPAVEKGELMITNRAYEGGGTIINSGEFDGMESENARREIVDWLVAKSQAKRMVNYRLQDWVFSRQRYWGEPIPIIRCDNCGNVPLPAKDLPLKLPKVKSYEPSGTGESPLATIEKWVNVKCPKCKGKAKRETNTMPQWAGSSWYYLAYLFGAKNLKLKTKNFLDDKNIQKIFKQWLPVDIYIGGVEHAARHLIYARFWHKVLYDLKLVSGKEPFKKLVNQGLILGPDGQKMSKSLGNVINPDEVVKEYGADVLRMYEMFMGPLEDEKPWDTQGIVGIKRFLDRVWNLQSRIKNQGSRIKDDKIEIALNKTIKKVTEDIESFRLNTAISAMMILVNEIEKQEKLSIAGYESLVKLLSPFAPHLTEEIWQGVLKNKKSIHLEKWPKYNPKLIKEDSYRLIVQINGKTRGVYDVAIGSTEEDAKKIALKEKEVSKWIDGKDVRKTIFVKDKLINFIV